jgi:catechol 2,3-dioxygenase-like lactoylglutathione lyase family enzyme
MPGHLGALTLLVRDYDEAIAWYTQKLGFALVSDAPQGDGKRWVLVAPSGAAQTRLLLARAASPEQIAQIGLQAGGRVFLLLHTDDFRRDHAAFVAAGVRFCETPREEAYGMVAVFEDLYGNKWDLLELK